jgi:DnaJ-class molecular chaperone
MEDFQKLTKSCPQCKGLGVIEKISFTTSYFDTCLNCGGRGTVDEVDEQFLRELELIRTKETEACSICGKKEERSRLVTDFRSKSLLCLSCAKQRQ